jgi:hypothetical protein
VSLAAAEVGLVTVTNSGRSGISIVAELASHEFRRADTLERRQAFDRVDAICKTREAEQARAEGKRLLKPPERLIGNAGTEIVPAPEPDAKVCAARLHFVDTLAEPNVISVDASEHRAAVATRAGVLSQALDAAVSAGATNSIEKMLCHQMAAVHFAGMELLVRLQEAVRLPPAETARLTNAVARLFEVYQSGCLTLQKLKTKGTQRVVVEYQQVNVADGGQAVVTARLGRGSRRRGSAKNAR